MMMGLSGKIGVGVCDSLAVFAVGVDEKSVSANEDCENHRHQQRYFPYCPSHKEMRYEMRLQNYKRCIFLILVDCRKSLTLSKVDSVNIIPFGGCLFRSYP